MFQILFQISDFIMNEDFHDYASLALAYICLLTGGQSVLIALCFCTFCWAHVVAIS